MTSTSQFVHWRADGIDSMETLTYFTSSWLRTICTIAALLWLFYRSYLVLVKPVDELITLLGLEVPVTPEVALAGIKADGIILHWKAPDGRSGVVKYQVRLNGIVVGEVSKQHNWITVTGLKPNHSYVVRVAAINSTNFQAASAPLRVKTCPHSSNDHFNPITQSGEISGTEHSDCSSPPQVQPYKPMFETSLSIVSPPAMVREHSNNQIPGRRTGLRRSSPAAIGVGESREDSIEGGGTVQQLTEKLENLRRENDELETQIADDEEEFQEGRANLLKERDELREQLKVREDNSKDLRKQVAALERQIAAAQTKRNNKERILIQKQNERKKMHDDMERWEREMTELRAEVERLQEAKEELQHSTEDRIQELREKHTEEQRINKQLEDEIREKGMQIKELEEERKRVEGEEDGSPALKNVEPNPILEQRQWETRLQDLQQRYAATWTGLQQAQAIHEGAQQQLDYLTTRRGSQPHMFNRASAMKIPPERRTSQRRRTTNIRDDAVSMGFAMSSVAPFNSSISSISPNFQSTTPFFNINNGSALHGLTPVTSMSHAEIESLTGGAPMSPAAGALLPSGLFGDENDHSGPEENEDPQLGGEVSSKSSGSPPMATNQPNVFPGLGALPGLGAREAWEQTAHGPSSPISVHSPSPFASPRESSNNLANFEPSAGFTESDRRSIRSASGSFRNLGTTTGTSRFASMLGIRPRGKTTSDDGPPLGSLKGTQSQSLPRQDPQEAIDAQLRRGSYSGSWMDYKLGQMSNAFSRGADSSSRAREVVSTASPKQIVPRRRPFNMFATKDGPWLPSSLGFGRPSSPRPASTSSFENVLPRPSTESQTRFGWPIEGLQQRNSPLGPDWATTTTNSWSRHPSRRPSIQYGSSTNLVHEASFVEGDDEVLDQVKASPTQAPIGTRPSSSSANVPPTPPKLNPAAPNFKSKSFFSRDKKSKKEKEEDKDKEEDVSPPHSRQSKDGRSISTADSINESRDSLERSVSNTPSESLTPFASNSGKESLMQKLSRKSSSSKFKFNAKGGLFSKKASEVGTPDETDEDGGNPAHKQSTDSGTGSPQISATGSSGNRSSGLSWGSLKRIGKKGEKAPSVNESVASEVTDDESDNEGNKERLAVGN
ncbi:hypothetical protein M501DRAFT_1003947 [Patellaria atrata CBS 101060]|uniref:Fibronectin type-III domain-containing protein n=1 Tax=Patellaria atrata CBS 101060 TaxID=1346257 RepID=A0A9P4VRG2_9PEZI|nr:hypothetical protein M501DRAFT_1003947 [Patellaria atrata CBS 101060]